MSLKRLARRLEGALRRSRRDNPDGPLATYAWMWRVLMRSNPSRLTLVAKFFALVAADAALLLAWTSLRPCRAMLRHRSGRMAFGGMVAAVILMVFWLGRAPSYLPTPWSGILTIQLQANGLIRFEGQVVNDEQVQRIVEHFGVKEASVLVDGHVPSSRVFQVNDLLSTSGVTRIEAKEVNGLNGPGES